MNWLSALLISVMLLTPAACGAPADEQGPSAREYALHYTITPLPASSLATVSAHVSQSRHYLREMSFVMPSDSAAPEGDGEIQIVNGQVTWQVPQNGGRLEWTVKLANQRSNGAYDAWLNDEWGIFRAEDVIPRARTRTLRDATSNTTLAFSLPPGWSFISEYSRLEEPQRVSREGRRFAQPTGWIAVGKLGVRHETIAGTRVAVAGPEGQSVRRMDMLALLNWTLPEAATLLGNAPERLTIISADDPMWRGALSAPQSIFIHADRPLISENATSTLVHEMMHVALAFDTAPNYDWIAEGFAEYYSLELLHRGNAITSRRYARAINELREWGEAAGRLCRSTSTGPDTALATTVLRTLDREIRDSTQGKSSLDDVAAALSTLEKAVDADALRAIVEELTGGETATLDMDNLPGCRSIAARTAN
ncbi:MAG: hypothetical protein AAFN50_03050 [Pseudomonadota bacterium]